MSAILAVQKAVIARLTAALAPVKVYDHAPPAEPFPFVAIGRQQVAQDDSFTEGLNRHTLTLTFLSQYQGQREVLELAEQARASLHRASFALDTGSLVSVTCGQIITSIDADGVTYTGNLDVNLVVQRATV